MGAPFPGLVPAEQPAVDALQNAFAALDPSEKRKHEAVLGYWLSIRGLRDLPPLRDLDPLEISESGPGSLLLELVGGGEDAAIRHLGERLKNGAEIERIGEAPRPSILASIAAKLSAVAISRTFLAFEDEFAMAGATTHCWVTLLPLSSAGAWVDYVYAFVSFEAVVGERAPDPQIGAMSEREEEEVTSIPPIELLELEAAPEELDAPFEPDPAEREQVAEPECGPEPLDFVDDPTEAVMVEPLETPDDPIAADEESQTPATAEGASRRAGFSFDSITAAAGFYGTRAVKVEPHLPPAPPPAPDQPTAGTDEPAPMAEATAEAPTSDLPADEPAVPPATECAESTVQDEPQIATPALEGPLQSKLTDVRAKADEARMAKLRSNSALYEGLGAAYDFALDAEDAPEEYLRLVEEKGLKIKLRSPMTPVVKLAFEGMCDDATLAQLEAVLAWALKHELPRGTLAQRIEDEGGIGPILNGLPKAA